MGGKYLLKHRYQDVNTNDVKTRDKIPVNIENENNKQKMQILITGKKRHETITLNSYRQSEYYLETSGWTKMTNQKADETLNISRIFSQLTPQQQIPNSTYNSNLDIMRRNKNHN